MDPLAVSSHVALVFAMGMVTHIGVVHLWFWRRSDPAHLWVVLWCVATLVFQGARHAQIYTDDPETALRASRIFWAAAPFLVWTLLCFLCSLRRGATCARFAAALAVPTLALAALALGTGAFAPAASGMRPDWFGRPYIAVPAGPATLAYVPVIAAALVLAVRLVRATPELGPEKRPLLVTVLVYAGMGVASVLSALRWIPIPPMVEYGPLVVAVGFNYLLVSRHRRLQSGLEDRVAERTAEIAAAADRLAESEARYRNLVQNAPVGVFACDRDGRIVTVNPALETIVGSPAGPRDPAGPVNAFTHPPLVRSGAAELLWRCLERGESLTGEHTYTSTWGRRAEVRLTVSPIRDGGGQVIGGLGIVEDVGERRALERRLRQAQKLESVGQLAAGVAHEINNPMAYVRANLSLLRGEWEGLRRDLVGGSSLPPKVTDRLDEGEELIEEALEGVERTIAIVRDMNEFSRAGEGERVPADLNQLVEASVRMAAPHQRGHVRVREAYGPLPTLECAPGPLRQVFLNLIVNALQAVGAQGTVQVETALEGSQAVVRVRDDGPGVPPEIQERLFDPFFTTKEAGEGTGLGLYVSYEIVRLHGGEIRVGPAPGGGATFEVRLPLRATAGEPAPPGGLPAEGAGG